MKRTRIFLMAFAALLVVGAVSCNKEESNTDATDSIGGNPAEEPTDEWVDLGLPSGLLWAKCNLGAAAPEEYGGNYSWGETAQKEAYDWSHYRYCTVDDRDSLQTLTKYNTSEAYGAVDNLTLLQAMDDAATAAFGSGVRIPTKEEWLELIDNTTMEWVTVNGVGGRKLTASNGKSIFLPAAGSRNGSELEDVGSYGRYWASMLGQDYPSRAWGYGFNSENHNKGRDVRYRGLSVRPVRSASQK